jgi:hypothetical protein
MTITVLGQSDGSERDAADELRRRLQPIIRDSDLLAIVVGAKCFGEKRQDIDILALGIMAQGFRLRPEHLPDEFKTDPTSVVSG